MKFSYATALRCLDHFIIRAGSGVKGANCPSNAKGSNAVHPSRNINAMCNALRRCEYLEKLSKLDVIHIAGTKGKGTTAMMCEKLLRSYGYKTATYTSPHLKCVRERIRINGVPISEVDFARSFSSVYTKLLSNHPNEAFQESDSFNPEVCAKSITQTFQHGGPPRSLFFFYMTLMFFETAIHFDTQFLIVEVGLGGRYDVTNALQHITATGIASIGHDHMEILGNTLGAIAREKAAIIRPRVPTIISHSNYIRNEVSEVLAEQAKTVMAPLFVAPKSIMDETDIGGEHMSENASLAVFLVRSALYQINRGGIARERFEDTKNLRNVECTNFVPGFDVLKSILARSIDVTEYECLRNFTYEGRCMEIKSRELGTTFLLDGAHTIESMECCATWVLNYLTTQHPPIPNFDFQSFPRIAVLFNCMRPRDPVTLMHSFLGKSSVIPQLITCIYVVCPSSRGDSLFPSSRPSLDLIESESNGKERTTARNIDTDNHALNKSDAMEWQMEQAHALRQAQLFAPLHLAEVPIHVVHLGDLFQKEFQLRDSASCGGNESFRPKTLTLVCGSLYLVGDVLSLLEKENIGN